MIKRSISCLLVLALLLPFSTAFAAPTMVDVSLRATRGQTITLDASDFTDSLNLDTEEDVSIASVTFPTLPASAQAVIRLDGTAYVADSAVPIAAISADELTVEILAPHGSTISIPFTVTLSDEATVSAHLVITVIPVAQGLTYTLEVGEDVRIALGIQGGMQADVRYLFSLSGQNDLQHGTLTPVTGELGVFTYHATSVGTDSFSFTVTANGIVSEPATIEITVEPSSELPFLKYYDMPRHWASFSAGRLGVLEKIIGQQADGRFFFYPDKGITRGDFIIWLLAAFDIEPTDHSNTIFADRDIPSWMRGFINAATEHGIIQGVGSSNPGTTSYVFPNNPITRIEAIRMISIALGPNGHDDNLEGLFTDIDRIPGWAKVNVRHLYELDILNGDQNGYLHPQRNLSRGEAAELLYLAYKELVKQEQAPEYTPETPPEYTPETTPDAS